MKTDTLKTLEKLITGGASHDEVEQFVWDNFTVTELVSEYISSFTDAVTREDPAPIRVTEEEFKRHFRIIGLRPDGGVETRGRKAKENTAE